MFGKMNEFLHLWTKPAAARVVRALANGREALSIRDLARLADVAPATALRVVEKLESERLAESRRRGRLRLVRLTKRVRPEHLPPPASERAAADDDRPPPRSRRLPVRYVRAEDLLALGWPMRIPDIAVVPRRWAERLTLRQPTVVFRRERPLQWRRLRPEDVAVAMLEIDPIVSRALFERARLDRRRLRRRILEEGKLEAAASVGLAERLGLKAPRRVERIPEAQIQRQLRQNPPRRVVA